MRLIFDTNVLVSAVITRRGTTVRLVDYWMEKEFELVTSLAQLEELALVTRRPVVRPMITPSTVGRFINDLHKAATVLERLPEVDRSPDPNDNFLLAMAEVADADYLVTGDKRHVLSLARHGRTRIVSVRTMLTILANPLQSP